MKSFQTFVHVRLPALLIKRLLTQPVFGSYSAAGLLIKWGNARGRDVMGWISASKKCLWERTQHPPCTTFCLLQQSWGHVNCMGCSRTDGADNKKVRSSLLLGTLMSLRQLEGCFRKHCLLVPFSHSGYFLQSCHGSCFEIPFAFHPCCCLLQGAACAEAVSLQKEWVWKKPSGMWPVEANNYHSPVWLLFLTIITCKI